MHRASNAPGRPRVALIVDKFDWAFGHIATRVKREILDEFDVKILESSTLSSKDLLNEISCYQADVLHFFWRKELNDILNYVTDKARFIRYRSLLEKTHLSFSVPYHLYGSTDELITLSPLFLMSSGYLVTSQKLFSIYNYQKFVPSPNAVIRDLYIPSKCDSVQKKQNGPVKFIWVGNSQWGKWIGHSDYKGLHSIVKPVFDQLKSVYGDAVDCILVDAAQEKISRDQTMSFLRSSDILFCASQEEGTPLPLLEAMEMGCAVVTTDVGIAREVLPSKQLEFIVNRKKEDFFEASVKILSSPQLLVELQEDNRKKFEEIDIAGIGSAWKSFFNSILGTGNPQAIKRARFNLNPHYSSLSECVSHRIHSRTVLKLAGKISQRSRRSRLQQSTECMELKIAESAIYRIAEFDPGAIYIANPKWPGVFGSTEHLSDGNLLPYPALKWRNADRISDSELKALAAIICARRPQQVLFSGGERYQLRLAGFIKRQSPKTDLSLLWHGQIAQWIYAYEREVSHEWLGALDEGIIRKVGVFKESFERILKTRGYESYRLSNYLKDWPQSAPIYESNHRDLRIGLWSASHDWRKNIHTQLLAMTLLPRPAIVHHSFDAPDITDIMNKFQIMNEKRGCGLLERDYLLREMSKTDLTLYVTLGECSPMTPLESISMNSPALVGPVSDIYDCDALIKSILVVEKPDTPCSIAKAAEGAHVRKTEIISRRESFLLKTKELGQERLNLFLSA